VMCVLCACTVTTDRVVRVARVITAAAAECLSYTITNRVSFMKMQW
jgi:hypothetical protein